jgi:WD40 repeat protein
MDFSRDRESLTAEAMSPFQALRAIGCSDGSITIENLTGSYLRYVLNWHRLPVLDLSFSLSDGIPILASAGADNCAVFWRPKRGKWRILHHLEFDTECTSIAFSPNGHSVAIALGSGAISLRETVGDFDELRTIKVCESGLKIAYLLDPPDLLIGQDNGVISLYSQRTLQPDWKRISEHEIIAISTSDRQQICVITADSVVRIVENNVITELQLNDENIAPVACRWDPVTGAAYVIGAYGGGAKFMQSANGKWKQLSY